MKVDYDKGVVLWGRGKRGEIASEFFSYHGVPILSVVDSNEEYHGILWHNIKCIDFFTYLSDYRMYTLVITPRNNEDILDLLKQHNIENYVYWDEIWKDSHLGTPLVCGQTGSFKFDAYLDILSRLYMGVCLKGYVDDGKCVLDIIKNARCIGTSEIAVPIVSIYKFFSNAYFIAANRLGMKSSDFPRDMDMVIIHGLSSGYFTVGMATEAVCRNIPIVYEEDGMIRSVTTVDCVEDDVKFMMSHSVVFDRGSLHINAKKASYLEYLTNSDYTLSEGEYARARRVMASILKHKVSKYNNQPIYSLSIGDKRRKKVLIIDQVYGDMSIPYGLATDGTFYDMYKAAVKENPDADIIIKTHTDRRKGHFKNMEFADNVYYLDKGINPIALLEYVDVVYVCTSQMGFEACMCGKEVHVFGMPFYAGWGFTHDRQKCSRRTRKRSVEEVFYFAYILYSHYVSYKTNSICEIEQCIEEIIELRDEYFLSKNNMGMNI